LIWLFWLSVSLLILLALAFILPPLWRVHRVADADMDARNIAIAKTRLAELKEQLSGGMLSPAQYEAQRTELELALSDDLDIAQTANTAASQGRWLAYLLAVLVPLGALALYAGLGNYQAITPTPDMLGATQPASPKLDEINKMVDKLAKRMESHPNDAEGWTMLGKSYKYLQQYPKAADAFGKAYALLGEQPEIMLSYADALAFANGEQMAGKPAELVFKVLAREPDNINALWYGGMAKAQAGDAVEGVRLWRKLLALLPPNSQSQQEVQELLGKLEATLPNGPAGTPATTSAKPAASAVAVTVQASLAPEFKSAVSPSDTVFIYAQAITGGRMPLAIVRKSAADLPLTVTLTDEQAMMPNMKLSNFSEVKLLARLSKSGNAMAQSGDLLGTIESVSTTDKTPHTLVINGSVK